MAPEEPLARGTVHLDTSSSSWPASVQSGCQSWLGVDMSGKLQNRMFGWFLLLFCVKFWRNQKKFWSRHFDKAPEVTVSNVSPSFCLLSWSNGKDNFTLLHGLEDINIIEQFDRRRVIRIGLPHLKKQNSWQPQWLLFATTNMWRTILFIIFFQLPIHRRTVSQNCCTIGYKR